MNTPNEGRIQIHGAGVGEISDSDLARRADEIARMDGRAKANPADLVAAREEIQHTGPPPAPEADETVTPIRHWSDAPTSLGHQAPRIGEDDEISLAEQLVNEGLEEADRDQRLSASLPPGED